MEKYKKTRFSQVNPNEKSNLIELMRIKYVLSFVVVVYDLIRSTVTNM